MKKFCKRCATIGKTVEGKQYDDLEEFFQSRKNDYFCESCHDVIYNILERSCSICGAKVRSCVC